MGYRITVKNRSKEISEDHIIQVAKSHLNSRKAKNGIFEVEIVGKKRIQELNRKFRDLDYPTDVLSFPVANFPLPTGRQADKEKLYGTIFLCSDIIKLNAQKSGKTFQEELDFILAHGLDHLLGIHHK